MQPSDEKVHGTVLEIRLDAIVHNLNVYRNCLSPGTKVMAMVKAFSYGHGDEQVARVLQDHKADYLGVAYTDEGVSLRKAGITMPLAVMNPEETGFEILTNYHLEPVMYSTGSLQAFDAFLQSRKMRDYPVHLEIETGMNRLGFSVEEIRGKLDYFVQPGTMKVESVFSHLASSEDPGDDRFTLEQFQRYKAAIDLLKKKISYPFIQHIANSAAIFRFPQLQLDMVRLGVGLYGVDPAKTKHQAELQPVATLRSTIAQVKKVKAGEAVSYNRRGVVARDSLIATVRIGYADGYFRSLGNGAGRIWVKGKLAPVIGTVCMDMTMIDVTGIEGVREGDEVTIFGKELPVSQVAEWAGTIPYEIMTAVSNRVKRVYTLH